MVCVTTVKAAYGFSSVLIGWLHCTSLIRDTPYEANARLVGEGGGRGGEGRVTRVNPIMHDYRLDVSHLLTRPSTQKDLGITISKDLKWNSNINQAIAC